MISFQDAFTNSTLDVVLADTSIAFPYDHDTLGDDWLAALKSADAERSIAFFGGSSTAAGESLSRSSRGPPRRKTGLLSHRASHRFQCSHRRSVCGGGPTRASIAFACILVARPSVLRRHIHIVCPDLRGTASGHSHLSTFQNVASRSFAAAPFDLSPNYATSHPIRGRG